MRKIPAFFVAVAILVTPPLFAEELDNMSDSSKPCAILAKACVHAGFVRTAHPKKKFWQDCMKPMILGKTVPNVMVDSTLVTSCRADKIKELKKELNEFQAVPVKAPTN